jgi:CxxC motif-containing protein
MEEIRLVKLEAPINVGDIIIKNVANTNVDIVATQTINKQ